MGGPKKTEKGLNLLELSGAYFFGVLLSVFADAGFHILALFCGFFFLVCSLLMLRNELERRKSKCRKTVVSVVGIVTVVVFAWLVSNEIASPRLQVGLLKDDKSVLWLTNSVLFNDNVFSLMAHGPAVVVPIDSQTNTSETNVYLDFVVRNTGHADAKETRMEIILDRYVNSPAGGNWGINADHEKNSITFAKEIGFFPRSIGFHLPEISIGKNLPFDSRYDLASDTPQAKNIPVAVSLDAENMKSENLQFWLDFVPTNELETYPSNRPIGVSLFIPGEILINSNNTKTFFYPKGK